MRRDSYCYIDIHMLIALEGSSKLEPEWCGTRPCSKLFKTSLFLCFVSHRSAVTISNKNAGSRQ